MLQDVKKLCVRINSVDEWSVYKITATNKQRFILFSFSTQEEAIKKGKAIARVLGLKLEAEAHINFDTKVEKMERPEKKKHARVVGVVKLCRQLLSEGKSTSEIETVLTKKYEDAGRDTKEAKWSARAVISGEKKKK